MKKLLFAAIAAFLSFVVHAQTNIIGGNLINIASIPWQVSIRNISGGRANGIPYCGGTIISDRWILTAAHCFGGTNPSNPNHILVNAGVTDKTDTNSGQLITASQIYVHPGYNPNISYNNDIALIKLSAPLSFNSSVQPVAYSTPCNTPDTGDLYGKVVTLSGWGDISNTGPSSQFLKATQMIYILNHQAYNANVAYDTSYTLPVTNNMISFTQPSGPPTGAARGDSGGPATIWINGVPIVIGASSWGYAPKDYLPTMYTKVQNYTRWIDSITTLNLTPQTLDLYTKDNAYDLGYVGANGTGGNGDKSPDIWVRNQPDGLINYTSQDPEYSINNPVYAYVRVRNKSCVPSTGTEKLSLYWSRASVGSSWPNNWNGSQAGMGDTIGSQFIPVIQPGKDTILRFDWRLLNPDSNSNRNSCLLSRIENSTVDPIIDSPNLYVTINQNNNVSIRNVTVVNLDTNNIRGPWGGEIFVGNILDLDHAYNIRFQVPDYQNPNTPDVTREAEVHIRFDEVGWNIIKTSGQLAQEGIKILPEREIIIHHPNIELRNIAFPAGVRIPLNVSFNFLTDQNTPNQHYDYVLSQSFAENPAEITGWETFEINKTPRQPFNVDAGNDKTIKKGDSVILSPNWLAEVAEYNWYDEDGNLIYTGKDLKVAPDVAHKYKLEVIATTDGFKDYDEVNVDVKKFYLNTLSPNPATTNINIGYNVQTAGSAYLMIVQPYGSAMYNYVLPAGSDSININTSVFAPGAYNVVLVCDGQAVDVKSFIVQ